MLPASLHAQQAISRATGDTLEVRYRVGQSDIDLSYAGNQQRIDDFVRKVNEQYAQVKKQDLRLDIYTGASPEGPTELNRRLGEQRGLALKKVLEERIPELADRISVFNQGARWGGLYKMVEQSNEPWKHDVLYIIGKNENEDVWRMDPREQKLRQLNRGAVWRVLNERYLPTLRSSGSAIIARVTEPRDTIVIRDTVYYLPEPCPIMEEPVLMDHVWAIKTNLLLWGVIAPNLQVERSLGKTNHWSIEGEVFFPWWTWSHNAHAEQFLNVGAELRYWLGDRTRHHRLDGWHLGAGLGIGYYDFEWKRHEGWQGEYLNIYCNFGYQHRWGKHKQWAFDGGLAVGYIPTKYRHYLGSSIFPVGHEEEYDDHLMWQNTGWNHILGLTHANFSIAYIINAKKKQHETIEVTEAPELPAPAPSVATSYAADDKAAAKEAKAAAKAAEKAEKQAAKEKAAAEKQAAKAQKEAEKAAKKAAKEAQDGAEEAGKAKAAADKQAAKAAAEAQRLMAEEQANAERAARAAERQAAREQAKAEREAQKAEREAQKAAANAEREAQKAEREIARAAAKAEREAAKAAAQAEREAAKAAAQAEKAAAKAAAQAEKDAAKAAKAAEKALSQN